MGKYFEILRKKLGNWFTQLEPTEKMVATAVLILTVVVVGLIGAKFITGEYENTTVEGPSASNQVNRTDRIIEDIVRRFETRHGNVTNVSVSADTVSESERAAGQFALPVLQLTLDPIIPTLADEILFAIAEKYGLVTAKTLVQNTSNGNSSGLMFIELKQQGRLVLTIKIEVTSERLHEEKLTEDIAETRFPSDTAGISPEEGNRQMMIIIDDFGYDLEKVKKFESLHPNLIFSVLPFVPRTKSIITHLQANNRSVMLHMPMEPEGYPKTDPGPGVVLTTDTPEEVRQKLLNALEDIGPVTGVNNHMGSRFTGDAPRMDVILRLLADRQMFFIDSYTSLKSKVAQEAKKVGVTYAVRDVFLDNDHSKQKIRRQFQRAVSIAQKKGRVIVIGHPFPATYDVLREEIPALEKKNIRIIPPEAYFAVTETSIDITKTASAEMKK